MSLDLDAYPLKTKQILRFGDTDQQGHINNAVYATFFESGRVEMLYDQRHNLPPDGTAFVVAKITIQFLQEILFPGEVIIGTRITRIGTSSMGIEQAVYANDACSATAESVVVLTNLQTRRSTPLPEDLKTHFTQFMTP